MSPKACIFTLICLSATIAIGLSAHQKDNINMTMNQQNFTPTSEPTAGTIAFLVDYFQKTTAKLKIKVGGLTEAQLQFKPAADRWSIAQCLEHLVAAETAFLERVKTSVETPATPAASDDRLPFTDETLIAALTDRSRKAEAPEALQFDGKYTDPSAAMADFEAARVVVLDYIKAASPQNLRKHTVKWPFGNVDGYHSLLLIAAHTARHTLQIEEVMANPDFPK